MDAHAALAAGATVIAVAFALCTLERYRANRSRHELVWTVALVFFAIGSGFLWLGASIGWSEWVFKGFYLFGAVLNVPFLALGTVYLLAGRRVGDPCLAVVALASAFAAGVVVAAPLTAAIPPEALPRGSEVFGAGPRIAAALFSGLPSLVLIGGALWSAGHLGRTWWRSRRHGTPARTAGGLGPGRLALANLLIAIGAFIEGAAGVSNSVLDAMSTFAVLLVVGITVIFAGFLLTSRPTRAGREWHAPAGVLRRAA